MKNKDLKLQLATELGNLADVPQRKDFHPEGDVLTHTLIVWYQAYTLWNTMRSRDNMNLMWVALFHDMAKKDTLAFKDDGTPTAYGHDKLSIRYVNKYADLLPSESNIYDIKDMCEEHMRYARLIEMRAEKQKQLLSKMGSNNRLMELFCQMDDMIEVKKKNPSLFTAKKIQEIKYEFYIWFETYDENIKL